jgi:hypothetical protein
MVTPIDHFPLIFKAGRTDYTQRRCQEATDYTLKYGGNSRQKPGISLLISNA